MDIVGIILFEIGNQNSELPPAHPVCAQMTLMDPFSTLAIAIENGLRITHINTNPAPGFQLRNVELQRRRAVFATLERPMVFLPALLECKDAMARLFSSFFPRTTWLPASTSTRLYDRNVWRTRSSDSRPTL
jgi:hypothetical protein